MPIRHAGTVGGLALITGLLPASLDAQTAPGGDATVVDLVQRHCLECHNDALATAGLSLSGFQGANSVRPDRQTFTKMLAMLQQQRMPPPGQPALRADQHARLTGWLAQELASAAIEPPAPDPGFVPPRRLNRHEYAYTVQDLFGLPLPVTGSFPRDQVYDDGFDTEALALSVDPLWFESALTAADTVIRAVWADSDARARLLFSKPTPPDDAGMAVYVSSRAQAAACCSTAADSFTIVARFRAFGEATIFGSGRLLMYGSELFYRNGALVYAVGGDTVASAGGLQLEDGDAHTVALTVSDGSTRLWADGRLVDHAAVKRHAPGSNDLIFVGAPREFSDDRATARFIDEFEELAFYNRALPDATVAAMTADADAAVPGASFRWVPGTRKPPEDVVTGEEAAEAILRRFLPRVFRRPVQAEELTRYIRLYRTAVEAGQPFDAAMQVPVKAALASPAFLFRVETDPGDADVHAVASVDMASRLSYFLWSSMPDDALRTAADRNELADPAALWAQAERMLEDVRADRFFERFTLQWLRTDGLGETIRPDAELFPDVTRAVLDAMRQESVHVFADMMRENRSVLTLVDSDYTFVNGALAAHYGYDDVTEHGWRRIRVRDADRGGVMTHAGVLTVSSSPGRTSPVFRGKWVLDVLLGEPPPPPPPDVPGLPEAASGQDVTQRALLERHRRQPACAGCHSRIDPLGLALEQFDAVGRRRSQPQDTRAMLPGGTSVDGAADLKRALLAGKTDGYTRHLIRRLLSYALGRALTAADEEPVERIHVTLKADDYRARTLVRAIVLSDPFRFRRIPPCPGCEGAN